MQRLGGPWRLLGPVSHALPYAQVRFAGTRAWRRRRRLRPGEPLRESYSIFEFPEVVLDLDAEDSPHVRPVNETDWQREVDKYAVNPAVEAASERVAAFEEENHEAHKLMMSTAHQRFGMWQVSDMDVLSVALKGAPRGRLSSDAASSQEEQRRMDVLSQVLQQNGITDRIMSQDDMKVIHFMMHRQSLAQRVNPLSVHNDTKNGAFNVDDVQFFQTALSRCGFSQMQRLVSRLGQTDSGCQLLSKCGGKIAALCSQFLRDGLVEDVLVFLNNLTSNLQSRSVDIDMALCVAGLRASTIAAHAPAALRYIELSQGKQDLLSTLSAENLQTGLASLLEAYSRPPSGPEGTSWRAGHRSELFTLLTGRGLTSYVPQESLRAKIGHDTSYIRAYSSYVVLLGELGALRMLWHEWHTLKTMKGKLGSYLQQGPKHQLFANALAHYATSLKRRHTPFVEEDYTTVTGDYAEDAALDLQCISSQMSHMLGVKSAERLSSNSEDTATLAEQLTGDVRAIFRVPDLEVAMRRITALMSTTVAER